MIEKLQAWGCDVESALERFVDDRELYLTCFNMFLDDNSFVVLRESIEKNDCKSAFEACHTLKGVSGNLSAGPLYEAVCTLTEKLRVGNMDNAMEHFEEISFHREKARELLAG